MNTAKWSELLESTNGLVQPGMVKELLSKSECEKFLSLIAESTRSFIKEGKPNYGLKVFLNGLQDNVQNNRLLEDPLKENESLEDWGKRFFKEEPFGFIMNFLEDYSDDIVAEMATCASPLLETHGMPLAGLSLLFFMGDYGYTPFGVHRGSPGEDGILFHLGPATKTFYIWDTDEYNHLTGNAPYFKDVGKILHAATPYVLESGDVISFPDHVYHVAYTPTFSVSMVLDYKRAERKTVKQLLVRELEEVFKTDNQLFTKVPEEGEMEVLNTLGFVENSVDAVKRLKARLKSNGGFYKASKMQRFPINLSGRYTLKTPFIIQEIERPDGKISHFIRGHEIVLERDKKITRLVGQLNEQRSIDLAKTNINPNPTDPGFSLFDLMMRIGQTGALFEV